MSEEETSKSVLLESGLCEEIPDSRFFHENIIKSLIRKMQQKITTCETIITNKGESFPKNYISNKTNNRKYSLVSFLPLFLFNEYKQFLNFYFLAVILSQLYKPFQVGSLTRICSGYSMSYGDSLAFVHVEGVMGRGILKIKLTTKGVEKISAQDIRVGDFLVLEKNERVPVDMILLHSNDENGSIFVRTDQLDGETDWKVRESVKPTQNYGGSNYSGILNKKWNLKVDLPRDLIYHFNGGFYDENSNYIPLKLENTIWASMKIASGKCLGVVIYCGKESRIGMNRNSGLRKFGKTDIEVNNLVKMLFYFIFILSLVLVVLSKEIYSPDWWVYFVRNLVIYSFIVPISLKINLEFAKLHYSYWINGDKTIKGTICRNSSIPEELGRIQYLLSDKTGTLTKNEMLFRNLNTKFGKYNQEHFSDLKNSLTQYHKGTSNSEKDLLSNIMLSFMLCNNVCPVVDKGERFLQASSPDEVALVNFAESMGFSLLERKTDFIKIKTPAQTEEEFKVLFNFPFSSETKRMGIVVRNMATKEVVFFLKGADEVIQNKVGMGERVFIEEETGDLSTKGLRTLVFVFKKVSEEELKNFENEYNRSGEDLKNRRKLEKECLEKFEKKMVLLGITGVEDLLQDEVKSVISNLREAGIKVWMLTGDKLETAKCIAISTGFKTKNQKFYEISNLEQNVILKKLNSFDVKNEVLLISGNTLDVIFKHPELCRIFFNRAKQASSVVLCRCAPKQKAMITSYIKNQLGKITCAIGDGGNDVGMIQSSNLGIGIEGKEGKQASLSSDISVKRIKDILILILWHGRLSYVRTSNLTNFIIHRGLIINVIQILFMITFYFVSISIYNGLLTTCYTSIFTAMFVYSLIYDYDIPIEQVFNYPGLYSLTQNGRNLSPKTFLIWLFKSVFQGSVIILLSFYLFKNSFIEIITITFTSLIFIEILNIYSVVKFWHKWMFISIFCSLLIYIFSLVVLREYFLFCLLTNDALLKIILLSLAAWLPFQIIDSLKTIVFPSQIDKVIREAKLHSLRLQNTTKLDQVKIEL